MGMTHRYTLLTQTLLLYAVAFLWGFIIATQPAASTVAPTAPSVHPTTTIMLFALASAAALTLVKNVKTEHFWQLFFGVVAGAGLVIALFYTVIGVMPTVAAYATSLTIATFLIVYRKRSKRIWIHNGVVLIASVGVGRLFGVQFAPQSMTLIVGFIAVYDIIAVYFSKQMFSIAKALFEHQSLFGFILTPRFSDWRESFAETAKPRVILGAGDIAFPLCLALSYLTHGAPILFLVVTIATLCGIVVLYAARPEKRPLPALPVLIGCALIALYVATRLI